MIFQIRGVFLFRDFFLFCFFDSVLLYILNWPKTRYVNQTNLELKERPVTAPASKRWDYRLRPPQFTFVTQTAPTHSRERRHRPQ